MNYNKTASVVLNYNSYEMTFRLVNVLQNYSSVDYVVVVDNSSTDDSGNKLKKLNQWNEKVIFLLLDNNVGYAKGNNIGAQYAIDNLSCKYINIANPDVYFSEEYLLDVRGLLDDNSEIILASSIAHDSDDKVSYCSYWDLPSFKDYIRQFFPRLHRRYNRLLLNKQNEINKKYVLTEAVSGACFLAKEKVFSEIGGFDENTFLYCEESILGAKIKQAGYKEAVSYNSYYIHYHQYKNEKFEKKISQYKTMISSREYYLKNICHIALYKYLIYKLLAKISLCIRAVLWRIKK